MIKSIIALSLSFIFLYVILPPQTIQYNIIPTPIVADIHEVECMTQNIYFEARGEPYEGKLAVATVVVNRTKSPDFPTSVCEVIYQRTGNHCQFSWVCQGKKYVTDETAWQQSQDIAVKVLTNDLHYVSMESALFYHSISVHPHWKHYQKIGKIGNHIFYRMRNT